MKEHPLDPDLIAELAGVIEDPTADQALAEPDPGPSPLELLVAQLPPPDRDVIEMVFYALLPKAEVAKTLGLSRSYVHRVVQRALDTLRGRLV